VWNKLNL